MVPMFTQRGFALYLCLVGSFTRAQTNLFTDGGFEVSTLSDDWYCDGGCSVSLSDDAHTGDHSIKVTDTSSNSWQGAGLAHNVDVTGGSIYKIEAYVKFLSTANGATYQSVDVELACDGGFGGRNIAIGTTPHMEVGEWHGVGGASRIDSGSSNCHVYIQTGGPAEYVVDDVSIIEVPYDNDWKTKAEERINQYRMADITIESTGADLEFELTQTRMEFAFGSAVDAGMFIDPSLKAYQDVFYNNFEWGVLENALKWAWMEPSRGDIDYDTPLAAMDAMIEHGKKVRCHCVFWDKAEFNEDWVNNMGAAELNAAIDDHITTLIGHTEGKCEHWDVNNEMLHEFLFEDHTGNTKLTEEIFGKVHQADPVPTLFLNDYYVVSGPDGTVAMRDLALRYLDHGTPVGGIGVQGHLTDINIQVIKARTEMVEEAGLPIWVTEMGMNARDATTRATLLVDTLTMYFSLPVIKGIIFWGYWDGRIWEENAVLYEGDNVTPNAAGLAYEKLFHETWRTKVTDSVSGGTPYTLRAYKGEYELKVKEAGQVVQTKTFTLADEPVTVQIGASSDE